MYFDLEDRRFDTPTIESAMSWREQSLLALFVHLLVAMLVFVVPQLQFVKDAAARREERLAQLVEEQRIALLRERQDAPDFMFVVPLIDTPALEPPLPQASLSDIDRVAASPSQAEDPLNDLPNADGNSPDFVVAEDPSIGVDSAVELGEALEAPEAPETVVVDLVEGVDDSAPDVPEPGPDATPGDGGRPADVLLADRGEASRETPRDRPPTERPGSIFRPALQGRFKGLTRTDTFRNLQGRTDQYGSDIQFDTKGVDFGSWIRRFRALIYRNWHLPYAIWSMSGHVVLTFNVHRDGTMTDLTVLEPSTVNGFTNSAHNALFTSNPVPALPPEYPDDTVFFTVIFYFNERPVDR